MPNNDLHIPTDSSLAKITLEPKGRWISNAHHCFSPFQQPRPDNTPISLLVIHNISLPAGIFAAPYVHQLFLGCVQSDFAELETVKALRVSAHLLIRRNGMMIQYVPFDRAAWHAGKSCFEGQTQCNEFSIGIELEGTDDIAYTQQQYQTLAEACRVIIDFYPQLSKQRIVGHSDIAPDRKTDPGPSFNWAQFKALLNL